MDALLSANRWIHIVVGFVGLAAWWVPIVTRKGGRAHKMLGKLFVTCAYLVAASAILGASTRFARGLLAGAAIGDNREAFGFLIFLGYLGLVTLMLTHYALRTVRTRRDPDAIRTPFLIGVTAASALGSVAVIAYALLMWSGMSVIFLALGPVGLIGAHGIHRYLYRRPANEKMTWFYEHMGAMLGAGIAFHTAFLVFGSRVVFDLSILGAFNWVPWVLPALIGTIGGGAWERYYRRRFGDLPAKRAAAGAGA